MKPSIPDQSFQSREGLTLLQVDLTASEQRTWFADRLPTSILNLTLITSQDRLKISKG